MGRTCLFAFLRIFELFRRAEKNNYWFDSIDFYWNSNESTYSQVMDMFELWNVIKWLKTQQIDMKKITCQTFGQMLNGNYVDKYKIWDLNFHFQLHFYSDWYFIIATCAMHANCNCRIHSRLIFLVTVILVMIIYLFTQFRSLNATIQSAGSAPFECFDPIICLFAFRDFKSCSTNSWPKTKTTISIAYMNCFSNHKTHAMATVATGLFYLHTLHEDCINIWHLTNKH